MGDDRKADLSVPYDERPWDDTLCLEALEVCPWKTTDHDNGEGSRRDNYCTWCEGYVTAAIRYRKAELSDREELIDG